MSLDNFRGCARRRRRITGSHLERRIQTEAPGDSQFVADKSTLTCKLNTLQGQNLQNKQSCECFMRNRDTAVSIFVHIYYCKKYLIYTHHQYNIKIAKHSYHLYKLIWTLSRYGSLLVTLLKVSAKLLIMLEDMPTVKDHSFMSSCSCRTDGEGMPSVSSVTISLCKRNILLLLLAFIL